MSRRPRQEESSPKVPVYIVTFSDMVTLLLTFFVMLISMADTQVEDHKFMAGSGSVKRALADFGISGFVIDQSSGPIFDNPHPEYSVEKGEDEPEDRSIDSHTEMLRRILLEIESKMKISPSQIDGVSKTFLQTEIRFAAGSWELTENAKKELTRYWMQIRTGIHPGEEPILYVLGLAGKENNEQLRWKVSAWRAQVVKDYLETLQNDSDQWTIFCWGAADGGEWTGKSGMTNPETQIVLAVLIKK